jgi:Glycosyl transferase family 21
MFSEWVLAIWSGAGIAWWMIAWGLVAAETRRPAKIFSTPEVTDFISIFKPLAPLGAEGLPGEGAGLESFIAQLDERSELLLGIHEEDREVIAPFLQLVREKFPKANLRTIFRAERDEWANPKIAWQKVLAPQALGELWLWSDADIIAPRDFLASLRGEYAGSGMLTFPYVMREVRSRPAFLDVLFVNLEFYPGVLLLRRLGPVDFGLGAGMLFRREDFLAKVDWAEIGSALADDFMLGQKLRPVRVSETTLVTVGEDETWRAALRHYLRWSKTVWWSRPMGAAAKVAVLPVLGWLIYAALFPGRWWAWAGLFLMMQIDVIFAVMICRRLSCRHKLRDILTMEAWSVGRVLVWLACWFPWAIVWQKRHWSGPHIKKG